MLEPQLVTDALQPWDFNVIAARIKEDQKIIVRPLHGRVSSARTNKFHRLQSGAVDGLKFSEQVREKPYYCRAERKTRLVRRPAKIEYVGIHMDLGDRAVLGLVGQAWRSLLGKKIVYPSGWLTYETIRLLLLLSPHLLTKERGKQGVRYQEPVAPDLPAPCYCFCAFSV